MKCIVYIAVYSAVQCSIDSQTHRTKFPVIPGPEHRLWHGDTHYCNAHYTIYTTHCTINTKHYTIHNTHYTLHTTLYTLHTTHYTLHTTHYTMVNGLNTRDLM